MTITTDTATRALGLRITRLEAIPLHLKLKRPLRISVGASREILEVLVVQIHTDQGIVGIGETQAWRRQGGGEILSNLVRTITDNFQPLIVGRSPFDIGGILSTLDTAFSNSLYAQAAVSDALQDIVGKASGLPIHRLFGGESREKARLGVTLTLMPTTEELIDYAEAFYEQGYRYFGLKIGVDPSQDVARVGALRERFGDAVTIRVDANGALTTGEALALLKKLEQFDIDAAEQPVPSWDIRGLSALSRSTSIPIMVDESLSTDHSLLEIIRRDAATAIHTKLAKNGGMYRTWRLWGIAEAAGMRICPGNHPCTGVATAAAAQLCAAWPGPLIDGAFAVGLSGLLETDIITKPLVLENGEIRIPTGPGLGVELDLDAVNHFRIDT